MGELLVPVVRPVEGQARYAPTGEDADVAGLELRVVAEVDAQLDDGTTRAGVVCRAPSGVLVLCPARFVVRAESAAWDFEKAAL
jgi:hypothetical protein